MFILASAVFLQPTARYGKLSLQESKSLSDLFTPISSSLKRGKNNKVVNCPHFTFPIDKKSSSEKKKRSHVLSTGLIVSNIKKYSRVKFGFLARVSG